MCLYEQRHFSAAIVAYIKTILKDIESDKSQENAATFGTALHDGLSNFLQLHISICVPGTARPTQKSGRDEEIKNIFTYFLLQAFSYYAS